MQLQVLVKAEGNPGVFALKNYFSSTIHNIWHILYNFYDSSATNMIDLTTHKARQLLGDHKVDSRVVF